MFLSVIKSALELRDTVLNTLSAKPSIGVLSSAATFWSAQAPVRDIIANVSLVLGLILVILSIYAKFLEIRTRRRADKLQQKDG